MDFKKILPLIIDEFEKKEVNYALMGGFAMGILGVMRATVDLDFLILVEDMTKVNKILEKYEYKKIYKSENVSQYVSDLKPFGEIDFLHAFRKISRSMLKRAQEHSVFKGEFKVKVLIPEDIIGLKIQAFINDISRTKKETLDIESIMQYYGNKLDWGLIKEYFVLFNKGKMFKQLKNKYGKTE